MTNKLRGLFLRWIVAILDILVPKRPDLWVFASHQGISGNVRFLLDATLEDPRFADLSLVEFHDSSGEPEWTAEPRPGRVSLIKRGSMAALCAALRASCVFITHDVERDVGIPISGVGGRRLILNLWHGFSMKRHWLLSGRRRADAAAKSRRFNRVVATSHVDAHAKAACFGKSLDDIWITGYPRNDVIVASGSQIPPDLQEMEHTLQEQLGGRKLVLFAPTWRNYRKSFPYDLIAMRAFAAKIEANGGILGMRLHPKDEGPFGRLLEGASGSILDCGGAYYSEVQVLLRNTAVLITDYSSIWVDFLLLGRPIWMYWPDSDDYVERRGIIWDLERLLPGQIVSRIDELGDRVIESLDRGRSEPTRQAVVRELFHEFADNLGCNRILDRVAGYTNRA